MQMRAESSGNGSAASASSSQASAEPAAPEPKEHDGKSKSHGVSWSMHKEGKVSGKVEWHGRSGQLCRSVAPFKFHGTAKLAGTAQLTPSGVTTTGTAQASGKTSGGTSSAGDCAVPRTRVPPTKPAEPVTQPAEPAKPEPPGKTKPKPGDVGKPTTAGPKPAKPTTPTKPVGPKPEELEKPVQPPAEAPENVFGYEKPVLGCFEGQVFPLAADTQKLPSDYGSLKAVSVLYACEWDIAPRAWDKGFPGVAERFEWFAIRYAGSFRIANAGEYSFRISSDDGAKVTIDGKPVVDNDGQHPPKAAAGKVQLSAGDHQMVLEYFQGPRFEINLQLWVTPPGKPEELFTVR
jgi:hypothetical protein